MPYSLQITAKALREIDDVLEWRARRSIKGAVRWYVNLMEAIRSLADNPEQWGLAPESEQHGGDLRQLPYGTKRAKYRILFEIRGDTVFILRVRHCAQDLLPQDEL